MTEASRIHPTAVISPKAELAADVTVGPFTVIGDDVVISEGSTIASHVMIKGPTSIGRDCHIYSFASIGEDPQDKKYAGEPTRLEIGNGNTIREYCTLNRGTAQDQGVTRLGDDNWLMAYVHVAHDCQIGDHTIMANGATLAGHVRVDDWVICSGFAAIHQFCWIGAHSFIGAYAGITRDVPPYTMVFGNPPEPRSINAEGLKRRGFSTGQIRNIKEAFRILYRSGLLLADARAQLAALLPDQPELSVLTEFLDKSERGILR